MNSTAKHYTPLTWFQEFRFRDPNPEEVNLSVTFTENIVGHTLKANRLANKLQANSEETTTEILHILFLRTVCQDFIEKRCMLAPVRATHLTSSSKFNMLVQKKAMRPFQFFIYRQKDLLGSGATKSVYKAIELETENLEAVAVIDCRGPKRLKRAEQEARMQSKVSEIVFYTVDNNQFISAIRLANRGTLFSPLVSFTQTEKYFFCLEVIRAVKNVHEHDIVIGDVKGENILLHKSENGPVVARIGDFSHAFEKSSPPQIYTTSKYTTPEHDPSTPFMSHQVITQKSDIFQMGLTLWVFLHRSFPPPYNSRNFSNYIKKWEKWREGLIPHSIEVKLGNCLSPIPEHRPTAQQLEKACNEVLKNARQRKTSEVP